MNYLEDHVSHRGLHSLAIPQFWPGLQANVHTQRRECLGPGAACIRPWGSLHWALGQPALGPGAAYSSDGTLMGIMVQGHQSENGDLPIGVATRIICLLCHTVTHLDLLLSVTGSEYVLDKSAT